MQTENDVKFKSGEKPLDIFHDGFDSAVSHAVDGGGFRPASSLTGTLTATQISSRGNPRRFTEGPGNIEALAQLADDSASTVIYS